MFKNFFKNEQSHFLLNGQKSSIDEFSYALVQLANQQIDTTMNTVFEYMPKDELLVNNKNIKALGFLSLSYSIACFFYSAIVNAKLSDEVVVQLKAPLLKHISELRNENGSIWPETDLPYFEQEIGNSLVSISEFNIATSEGILTTDTPGNKLIDTILKYYKLPNDRFNSVDLNLLATKLNVSIKSTLLSFDNGVVQWVNC